MSAKAKERKKEEIVVVRNFPEFLIHRLAPSGIGGVVIVLMRCQLTGNPGQSCLAILNGDSLPSCTAFVVADALSRKEE
ncbi:hypothetical protein Tco_0038272 [Tanacetum coccineum]